MPPIRVTFFFKRDIDGWSETYFSTNPTITQVDLDAITLADLRTRLVSGPCEMTRVRCSDDAKKRDRLIRVPAFKNNSVYVGCDPSFTALRLNLQSGPDYARSLFMRGIPDSVVTNGEYNPGGSVSFTNALTAFTSELASGRWGVATRLINSPVGITAFTPVGGPSLAWNVTTGAPFTPVFGEVVQVLNGGPLNGANRKWRVSGITDATHLQVLPVGPASAIFFLPGMQIKRLFLNVQSIDRINNAGITHRDQGRPFGQHRGRRRALARS